MNRVMRTSLEKGISGLKRNVGKDLRDWNQSVTKDGYLN
jgi:hypothetical protein